MLSLFQSIFGGAEEAGRYPETLVRAAIERAVDGTDPWLRGLSRYRKKLRPAVLTAIDHVVALVDSLAPPRLASRDGYGRDSLLQAIFLSSEQMRQVLQDQLAAQPVAGGTAYALLAVDLEQRGTFGVELLGDTVVRDVPQVTVSFANHRLLDPTGNEDETRRLLKRRAFDHLLSLALREARILNPSRVTILWPVIVPAIIGLPINVLAMIYSPCNNCTQDVAVGKMASRCIGPELV